MINIARYLIGAAAALSFLTVNAFTVSARSIDGAWRGSLSVGPTSIPLVFNFSTDPAGKTLCTLDSPQQGAKGIPTDVTLCSADSVIVSCPAIGASYSGAIHTDSIIGSFEQRGFKFPLNLAPEKPLAKRRYQTPVPPFPYTVVDTTFTAPDGAVMSGTMTLPPAQKDGKVPAVLMVTGSGPQNRDEELFDHKPFAVIADYLARNGIASLRYDDRGTNRSAGNFNEATTMTLKEDAASGIRFLRTVGNIGPVGVLGHSEGGTIALMLGAEGEADFVISLAGMAESGKQTIMRQNRHSIDKAPIPEDAKESSLKLIEMMLDEIADQTRKEKIETIDVDSLAAAAGLTVPPAIMASIKNTRRSPWLDTFLTIDPTEWLSKVKCPVLAVNGLRDTQVSPDNLEVIRRLVPQAQIMEMPGLNHLMQHCVTGEVTEYEQISETLSPDLLEALTRFLTTLR